MNEYVDKYTHCDNSKGKIARLKTVCWVRQWGTSLKDFPGFIINCLLSLNRHIRNMQNTLTLGDGRRLLQSSHVWPAGVDRDSRWDPACQWELFVWWWCLSVWPHTLYMPIVPFHFSALVFECLNLYSVSILSKGLIRAINQLINLRLKMLILICEFKMWKTWNQKRLVNTFCASSH